MKKTENKKEKFVFTEIEMYRFETADVTSASPDNDSEDKYSGNSKFD